MCREARNGPRRFVDDEQMSRLRDEYEQGKSISRLAGENWRLLGYGSAKGAENAIRGLFRRDGVRLRTGKEAQALRREKEAA